MKVFIKNITIIMILLLFDILWIYFNYNMYNDSVLSIQKSKINMNLYSTILAYILVIYTIFYISIPLTIKNINKNDNIISKLYKSFLYGGSVGLSVYGIYNCTSKSLYSNYEWKVALYDTIWGIFLNTIIVFIYLII